MPPTPPPPSVALAERRPVTDAVAAIVPRTVAELLQLGEILYKGGLGSKAGADRPEAVAAIVLSGLEIGLKPGQALSSIYLQGGRATLYGPMPLAMVRASGLLELFEEHLEGEGEGRTAVCRAKRKGDASAPKVGRFSLADARAAGLLDRAKDKGRGAGAWVAWQDRMLTFRARTPVLQDLFGDVLAGFDLADDRPEPAAAGRAGEATVRPEATTPSAAAGAAALAPPPTDVHGEVMIDDAQLREVKRLAPVWMRLHAGQGADNRELIACWQRNLRDTYGVESADRLTGTQAESLLTVLRGAAAGPTAALFVPGPPVPAAAEVESATA